MRVNSIDSYYSNCSLLKKTNPQKMNVSNGMRESKSVAPSFKGENTGMLIGSVAGFVALAVLCPAVVAVGLGGIGVMAGGLAGAAIDDKLGNDKK